MSLSINNICIGNIILRVEQCASTNIYAKELITKNEPIEGTVIITDKQTNGKGQYGNKWNSEYSKNLTFSIIIKPNFLKPTSQFYISKIVSIACVEALNTYTSTQFKIKWPNDIYYKNNKIGGVLIENIINSTQIKDSIIGIGININQDNFYNLANATSFKKILNKFTDKEEIFLLLLKKIDHYYLKLRNKKFSEIDEKYLNFMFGLNTKRQFLLKKNNETFKAVIKGIEQNGLILLKIDNKIISYNLKEIKWIF